ncbi:MAG: hypothetical protein WCQ55_06845 [Paludibacteraceae bacterium]|nr:hypothetical protein [Prevotellaceae bacterium]
MYKKDEKWDGIPSECTKVLRCHSFSDWIYRIKQDFSKRLTIVGRTLASDRGAGQQYGTFFRNVVVDAYFSLQRDNAYGISFFAGVRI